MTTILLVENEPDLAAAEQGALEGYGYRVHSVRSAEAAVDLLRRGAEDFNLVLLDIDPEKGIGDPEAARRILSAKDLPLVFLTSGASADSLERMRGIPRYEIGRAHV